MAGEPNENEDELLLTDQVDPDDGEDQRNEDDEQDTNVNDEDGSKGDESDEEEEVLTFGDDVTEAKPDDSATIRQMREELKKARKEIAEARAAAPKAEPVEVGPKPTLASCDYDEDEYEKQRDEWDNRRREADDQKNQASQAEETQRKEWEGELNRYNEGKAKLGFDDIDDAEETIKTSFDPVQQAVMVKASDDPARVMYALAKHPDRLTALAAIKDPLKLAVAIAKLEGQLKVVKRRKAPDPDTPVRGSGKVSTAGPDKMYEKLEAEADKTGDRTKFVAYKKQLATKK